MGKLIMNCAKPALSHKKTALPEPIVDEVLQIYKPQYRLIRKAVVCNMSVEGELRAAPYPYTLDEVFDYITAPTANVIACQLSYVLVGGLMFFETKHLSAPDLDWKAFLHLRDNALLKFSSFKFDFRHEVKNISGTACEAELLHIKRVMGHTHADIRFQIGQGISGLIHGVILSE